MSHILNFGHKEDNWFDLFHQVADNRSMQLLLKELIDETNKELLNINPGTDAIVYHNLAVRVWTRTEAFNQMLQFFENIKKEFEAKLRESES